MVHLITGVRLVLAIPAALAFAQPQFLSPWLLLVLISVAIGSDFLDGIVARRTQTASARGQLFDHTTDFLFVTCGLTGAAVAGEVTIALPVLIVLAFSQYVLDSHFLFREKRLRMSALGRWNGILYFVPLVVISMSRLDILAGGSEILSTLVVSLGYLLVLSTGASIVDRGIAPLRTRRLNQGPQPELR